MSCKCFPKTGTSCFFWITAIRCPEITQKRSFRISKNKVEIQTELLKTIKNQQMNTKTNSNVNNNNVNVKNKNNDNENLERFV